VPVPVPKVEVSPPELPLAWPIGAAITDRSVYVLDVYHRRVLRTHFVFAAEEVCDAT
jgi:hypothetical protein